MGVKTTISGLTYAASHRAAASTAAQNVDSVHREILLQATEMIKNLQILVATMQAGDPNIAAPRGPIDPLPRCERARIPPFAAVAIR